MPAYPAIRFLTSANDLRQLPADTGVEVAVAGRSNAGKSSAINAVTQRKGLARTSKAPGATRLLNFFELGVNWNRATNQPALGGSLKIGGYYHTGDFGDVYDGVTWAAFTEAGYPEPPVRKRSGNYGAYLLAEQQLFLEQGKADPARQGLLGFFRLLGAPADRNLAQLQVDGGLVFRGLIPTRDWDTLAFAVSYLAISDDIRHAQRDLNLLAPGTFVVADHETALELSYKIQATAWWTLQPSLQHVIHPGGSAATPDATVFILQSTLRF